MTNATSHIESESLDELIRLRNEKQWGRHLWSGFENSWGYIWLPGMSRNFIHPCQIFVAQCCYLLQHLSLSLMPLHVEIVTYCAWDQRDLLNVSPDNAAYSITLLGKVYCTSKSISHLHRLSDVRSCRQLSFEHTNPLDHDYYNWECRSSSMDGSYHEDSHSVIGFQCTTFSSSIWLCTPILVLLDMYKLTRNRGLRRGVELRWILGGFGELKNLARSGGHVFRHPVYTLPFLSSAREWIL